MSFITSKKTIIILIIAVAIIVGINIFIVLNNKNKSIPPQSIPQPTIQPIEPQPELTYTYQGTLPNMPTQIPIISINNATKITQEKAQTIAQSFDLVSPAQILKSVDGNVYAFDSEDKSKSLIIYPNPFHIDYTDSTPTIAQSFNENQIIQAADDFLKNTQLFTETYQLGKPYYQLVRTDDQGIAIDTSNPSEAEYAKITYNILINDMPVIAKDRQNTPIRLFVNPDTTIKRATISIFPDQLESMGTADLTDPQQALNAINAGGGIISKLNDPYVPYTQLQPGEIKTADLNSVEVVYLYDYDTNTLQPYYRFAGTAQSSAGRTIEIEVLITALPQDVFKK